MKRLVGNLNHVRAIKNIFDEREYFTNMSAQSQQINVESRLC